MEAEALQELRRRLGLAPTTTQPTTLEPPPVVANPEGRLKAHDAALAAAFPHTFSGCACPALLNEMPCPVRRDDDAMLCRFLRARQYDVDKAEKMLRACLAVRERWQMDSILEEPDPLDELWERSVPVAHIGYDKQGRPLIFERTGEVRVHTLMKWLTKEDFYYRHLRHMEIVERHIAHAARMYGPHVSQVVIVMDLSNLSFRPDPHAIPLFKQMINIDTSLYPERLGAFFIINAPWIFKPLWALIRPWLDPRTQNKFHVLGKDYAATLRQYIDVDQLPVEYGGTHPGQVPTFCHFPEDYRPPSARASRQIQALKSGGGKAEEDGEGEAETSKSAVLV